MKLCPVARALDGHFPPRFAFIGGAPDYVYATMEAYDAVSSVYTPA